MPQPRTRARLHLLPCLIMLARVRVAHIPCKHIARMRMHAHKRTDNYPAGRHSWLKGSLFATATTRVTVGAGRGTAGAGASRPPARPTRQRCLTAGTPHP